MTWSITRLVGCEHILQIQTNEATPVAVAPSTNPNGDPTGIGRKGKSRIAFILNNDDLSFGGDPEEGENQISLLVDSGIAFQSPPNELAAAADAAEYNVNTPVDLSTFMPIVHVTPYTPNQPDPANGDEFIAWEAKPFVQYNQLDDVGTRTPVALSATATEALVPTSSPNPNGQLNFTIGTANTTFSGTPAGSLPFAGSFLVEIDFSHSVAS